VYSHAALELLAPDLEAERQKLARIRDTPPDFARAPVPGSQRRQPIGYKPPRPKY
jgi:hypothetical protein